jgi:hypothetical protein
MQDATSAANETITNDEENVLIDAGSNAASANSGESPEAVRRVHLTVIDGNNSLTMIQVGQGVALTATFIILSLVFASVGANAPLTQQLMLNVVGGNLIVSSSVFAVWWNARGPAQY